jgi:hypothetical protein
VRHDRVAVHVCVIFFLILRCSYWLFVVAISHYLVFCVYFNIGQLDFVIQHTLSFISHFGRITELFVGFIYRSKTKILGYSSHHHTAHVYQKYQE